MRRLRLLAALSLAAAASGVAACGADRPGQSAAQEACRAYANTMRHQAATTVEGNDAIWATAEADAGRAASADRQWAPLQRDIDDFHHRLGTLSQSSTADELDAYFAADRKVQADCTAAGVDIGPLRP